MAQKLSITLTADLDLKRDAATCVGGAADVGTGFKLKLSDRGRVADTEISQKAAPIDASGGAVALPFPANLEGRVLLLSVLDGGPFDVQVTHAVQGATVYPVKSTLLLEPSDDEYITGISILTGVGTIEWMVSGTEA